MDAKPGGGSCDPPSQEKAVKKATISGRVPERLQNRCKQEWVMCNVTKK